MAQADPDDCALANLDYAVNVFGYHPQEIIDEVLCIVQDATADGVSHLKQKLISELELSPDLVEKGCGEYQRRLEDSASVWYDIRLRKVVEEFILSIPADVALPEDSGKCAGRTDQRAVCLKLAEEILQERCYQLELKERISQFEKEEAILDDLQKTVDGIGASVDEVMVTSSQVAQVVDSLDSVQEE